MAANEAFGEELKKAWTHHRDGRHADAIAGFRNILQRDDRQVDGLYGLGLAQRASGDLRGAIETFQRCLSLVSVRTDETPSDDKAAMLKRMVEQRIAESGGRSA